MLKSILYCQKVCHVVKRVCYGIKKYVLTSETMSIASINTSWSQKLLVVSKMSNTIHIHNLFKSILAAIWHINGVLLMIMYFSHILVMLIFTYTHDICQYANIISSYHHIKFCNNRATFNEVMVWYRRAYQFMKPVNTNQFMRRRNQINVFVRFKANRSMECLQYYPYVYHVVYQWTYSRTCIIALPAPSPPPPPHDPPKPTF